MSSDIRRVAFEELKIQYDSTDRSTEAYLQRPWFEEFSTNFYEDVGRHLAPDLLVDVGANYGVASVFMKNAMPNRKLISIEADPNLISFINMNLTDNGFSNFEVLNAIAGATDDASATFHLNPAGSQDSRVKSAGEDWEPVSVQQLRLDNVIQAHASTGGVFLKIDTQGFEENVFAGLNEFLVGSNKWLIKTEFAPAWLESQGTDPVKFLKNIVSRHTVCEFPARYSFGMDYRELLRKKSLENGDVDGFIQYVIELNRHNRGWVDLLVAPRRKRWFRFA